MGSQPQHPHRSLSFEHMEATLVSLANIRFDTSCRNCCWYIDLLRNAMQLNTITQHPSFYPFLWHRCHGHTSDKVVKKYVELHFDEIKKGVWRPFFCDQCAKSKSLDKKSSGANSLIPRDEPLDLLVSDIAGLFPHDMLGKRYGLTMCDHTLTYIWLDPH